MTDVEGHSVDEEYHIHSLHFAAGRRFEWNYGPSSAPGERVVFRGDRNVSAVVPARGVVIVRLT